MIDNKDSKKRYRVDHLIETKAEEMRNDGRNDEADGLLDEMDKLIAKDDFDGLRQLIINRGIKCPISKTSNWTEVRQFNLMFSTQIGSVSDESSEIYLRPETAQGIFVNFLNVQKTGRLKFPFGFKEVEGIHSRTDYDLKQHQEYSKKKMQYFDSEINQNYIPYVIETSIGLDRTILMMLSEAYAEEDLSLPTGQAGTAEKQDSRVVLRFPSKIAPMKLAVL